MVIKSQYLPKLNATDFNLISFCCKLFKFVFAVPSNPQNITNIHTQNDSVTLHWMEPDSPNGIITGYRLYYMTKKMTDVQTVKDSSKEIVYMLKNLSKLYKVCKQVMHFLELKDAMTERSFLCRTVYKVYNLGKSFHIKTRGQLFRHNRSIDRCVWSWKVSHHQLNMPWRQHALCRVDTA